MDEQDFIRLNEYLDDELDAQTRAALEQQLLGDPAMQADLDSLRATVALLQQLETVPVPRSFTLDPAQYGRKQGFFDRLAALIGPAPTAALSGLAAAAAAFVLVVSGTFLLPATETNSVFAPAADTLSSQAEESDTVIVTQSSPPEEDMMEAESAEGPRDDSLEDEADMGAASDDEAADEAPEEDGEAASVPESAEPEATPPASVGTEEPSIAQNRQLTPTPLPTPDVLIVPDEPELESNRILLPAAGLVAAIIGVIVFAVVRQRL
ncbi:MAG: hypothetical protein ACFB51_04240 [Anaerolineae bacterium]